MDEEPIYIAQTAEPMSSGERQEWYRKRAAEAKERGCTFGRYSHHPDDPDLLLVEGWLKAPKDQGELRWQLQPNPRATVRRA